MGWMNDTLTYFSTDPIHRKYHQNKLTFSLLYAYQYGHPGKKLLFMGQEFGQRSEFSEARSLDWHLLQYDSHRGIQRLVADLNKLYAAEPALHEVDFDWHGFDWLDCND